MLPRILSPLLLHLASLLSGKEEQEKPPARAARKKKVSVPLHVLTQHHSYNINNNCWLIQFIDVWSNIDDIILFSWPENMNMLEIEIVATQWTDTVYFPFWTANASEKAEPDPPPVPGLPAEDAEGMFMYILFLVVVGRGSQGPRLCWPSTSWQPLSHLCNCHHRGWVLT